MTLQSINPTTGELVRTYDELDDQAAADRVEATHQAWLRWRDEPLAKRVARIEALAGVLEAQTDHAARLMAVEMGKPLAEGRAEIDKCAWLCRWYAEHGPGFLADEPAATDALRSYVAWRPLGVILAIMPWNFPYWQVFRFAVPALLAGNAGVLKHASNVSGCALHIEALVQEAGFPTDLFSTLLLSSGRVAPVLEHPRIVAATLTGSTPAGRAVASTAGRLLKKTVLELGGSDPYVILEDADLDLAAEACATARLINGGQTCIAAKRFVVLDAVAEPFTERLVSRMAARRLGDPLEEGTDLGPQARLDLRDDLQRQVDGSLAAGARCLLGGETPAGPGAFYPPTVLADIAPGMPAWDEELFGPVAAITSVPDEEAAIAAANDTVFGLGAAVFTRDLARGEALARDRLEAGSCFVNTFVRSDPRLPFGGVKESGYGRELGVQGVREFLNAKTVWIDGP
jgi:succinate-semialdehyde dehydrogenase/glutarate-semialdehyde dehydrogenase